VCSKSRENKCQNQRKAFKRRELLFCTLPLSSSTLQIKNTHTPKLHFLASKSFIHHKIPSPYLSLSLTFSIHATQKMESLMRLVLVLFLFFVVFFVPLDHVSSESISRANFPDGFVFGTASSAYQVTFFFFFIFSKLIQQRKNEDFDNRNIFLQEISSKEL